MTRETNMAVGTRNGAGHGHLPLAGDRKTIETERKRYLPIVGNQQEWDSSCLRYCFGGKVKQPVVRQHPTSTDLQIKNKPVVIVGL